MVTYKLGKRTNELHYTILQNNLYGMARESSSLGVFRTDSGITLSFGSNTYFIESKDPFHNIALKSLDQNDHIPLYVEIAKREGVGFEFRNMLLDMIEQSKGESTEFEDIY
jgi:hypothetical protein